MSITFHLPGFFLTLEGGEGAGKSAQLRALIDHLYARGYPLVATREPGGTGLGDDIRRILLDRANTGMSDHTELLLCQASRAQLVQQVIRPALASGVIVICDRFFDSTTAYQGYGRGIDLALIQSLTLAATGGLQPDCTILLDIDPSIGRQRARRRNGQPLDRLERETLAFHRRVRQGYLLMAQHEPSRFVVIDASADPLALQNQLRTTICDRLQAHGIDRETIAAATLAPMPTRSLPAQSTGDQTP